MANKRHMDDTATYRELPDYAARVKSFNMTCNLLRKYTRVILELDVTPSCGAKEITSARLETIRKTLDAIAQMA